MANTTITQNDINFTAVDDRVNQYQGWGKKYSNSANKGDTYPADPNDIVKGVNAIEIDWNGAVINGATFSTSGQVLSHLQEPQKLNDRVETAYC